MSELDPLSDLNPVYSVSRIGGIQDEQKVRCSIVKNLWLMLRRNKVALSFCSFYWFEFLPAGYAFGLGMWTHKPSQFDAVRQKILEEPERWLEAVKATEDAGLTYGTRDYYKKDKVPDAPEALKQYLNAKIWNLCVGIRI